jgi:hypothetical protein
VRSGVDRARQVVAAAALSIAAVIAPAAASASEPAATPTIAYPPPGLAEASGLVASTQHPGVVWVMEDSGDPVVRAYDASGRLAAAVTMTPADGDADTWGGDIRDTEALALGPGPKLWVADIGDNSEIRETVVVHVLPEPATLGPTTEPAVSYRFRYPAGPRDAETFLVDPVDGRAYVATKGFLGGGLYAAPAELTPGATHDLTLVQNIPAIVSDGAFSPDGTHVVLRTVSLGTETTAYVYEVDRGAAGEPIRLGSEPATISLPAQAQGESITYTADGSALLIGSEGTDEPIWSVPLVELPSTPTTTQATGTPVESASPTPSGTDGRDAPRNGSVLPAWMVVGAGGAVLGAIFLAAATIRRGRR